MVDNEFFAARAREHRDLADVRPYLLASNRFIPKKNLFRLISAYQLFAADWEPQKETVSQSDPRVPALVLLGDGELRQQVVIHARDLKLPVNECAPWECSDGDMNSSGRIYLPGFRQIAELPRYYSNALAFIHASTTEQWGLVVNEAMASGLPVIVSDRCGCAQDLVRKDVNGWTFDPHDEQELAKLLRRIALLPIDSRRAMG